LKQALAQVDRHIAASRGHITKQITIIDRLERGGHDSTFAKDFLAILHKIQQMHEDHRERIMRELVV
jgi:hypothetical protein